MNASQPAVGADDLAAQVASFLAAGTRLAYAQLAPDFRILQTSGNFAEVLGPSKGLPPAGTPVTEVLWELVGAEESLAEILAGRVSHYSLDRINRQQNDGSLSYLNLRVVPMDTLNTGAGLLLILEDDTLAGVLEQQLVQDRNELRLTRTALQAANRELERLDRLKSLFLSIVVHDLRSPLTAMYGYTELVRANLADADGGQNAEYLSVVASQIQWLNRLASDLLDLDQLEQGELSIDRQMCDLAGLVRAVVDPMAEGIRGRGLALEVDVPDLEIPIYADPDRVQQVLYNLLGNAAKYTEETGAIRVRAWRGDRAGAFLIWNSGPGLTAAEQANLFQLYYRTEEAHQGAARGSGLGLFIVKSLVDAHGGEIQVHSGPESGTTFTVHIPESSTES